MELLDTEVADEGVLATWIQALADFLPRAVVQGRDDESRLVRVSGVVMRAEILKRRALKRRSLTAP